MDNDLSFQSFFFWSLHCLSFDLWLLITPSTFSTLTLKVWYINPIISMVPNTISATFVFNWHNSWREDFFNNGRNKNCLWWPCLLSTCGGQVCCPINMKWGSFIKDILNAIPAKICSEANIEMWKVYRWWIDGWRITDDKRQVMTTAHINL